jgi:hypothetical protein
MVRAYQLDVACCATVSRRERCFAMPPDRGVRPFGSRSELAAASPAYTVRGVLTVCCIRDWLFQSPVSFPLLRSRASGYFVYYTSKLEPMSIKQFGPVVVVWLASVVAACAVPVDEVGTSTSSSAVSNPDDPGGGDPGGGGGGATRSCGADIDCNFACVCDQGLCRPDGFGPGLPQSHCNELPTRLCWADSVCAAGCICGPNSHCQPDGFGPPNPDCHLPP